MMTNPMPNRARRWPIAGAVFGLLLPNTALADEARTSTGAAAIFAEIFRPGGLTAEVAAQKAKETSFDVKSRSAELRVAAAQLDDALIAYFPRLSGVARVARLSNIDQSSIGNLVAAPGAPGGPIAPGTPLVNVPLSFPVILNQTTLEATLSVPVSDYLWRLPHGYAAASRNQKAAETNEAAAKLRAAHEARLYYYTWVRAETQSAVAKQALGQAEQHLRDVKLAQDVGSVSRADALRVESQVASAELLVVRARNFAELALAQLGTAMHEPTAGARIGEDLGAADVTFEGALETDQLQVEALDRRLELKAIDLSVEGIDQRADATRALYFPRVDAFGTVTYANPNQRIQPSREEFDSSWIAGIQATFTVNDLFSGRAAVDNLSAQSEKVKADRAALADGLALEAQAAHNAWVEATAARKTSARGLASAEESYRVRRVLFKAGRSTSVELTDAETDLTRARLEAINAEVDIRIARAKLLHATGRDREP